MAKVIIGLSGGVDSAVAALLLKQAGYDVIGVTLRTWVADDGEENRCCEIDDARDISRALGIPYHVFNCTSEFGEKVIEPFINDYISGMTPNPCVICNREIKWDKMMYYAKVLGADCIATGHYASVVKAANGRYTVRKASHAEKDQAYMLYRLTQEQLASTLMPLGGYSKQEVREIAREAGLPVASKRDSQEICFVPDDDYAGFIIKNAPGKVPGEGFFKDESGNILGPHQGIIHYTVGQRKGLGIALGHPAYVKEIDSSTGDVILAEEEAIFKKEIICGSLNYMSVPPLKMGESLRCSVKIRYHHGGENAVIEPLGEDRVRVTFDSPVRAATPGQSAVFYDENDCVAGGGIILKD